MTYEQFTLTTKKSLHITFKTGYQLLSQQLNVTEQYYKHQVTDCCIIVSTTSHIHNYFTAIMQVLAGTLS